MRGGLTNLASSSNCSFTLASHLVSCHSSLLFSSSLQLTSLHTLPPSALSFRSSAVSLSCRVLLSRELNQRQSSPAPSHVESVLPKQKRKRQIRRANALIFSKTYVSSIPSSIQSSSMDSNKHHIYLLSSFSTQDTFYLVLRLSLAETRESRDHSIHYFTSRGRGNSVKPHLKNHPETLLSHTLHSPYPYSSILLSCCYLPNATADSYSEPGI